MKDHTHLSATARELRGHFDAVGYLERYPDVRESGLDPIEHYLLFGADDNRQPCPFFDGDWYKSRNQDVAITGINPLLHYVRHGGAELRDPHPRFNAAYYVQMHPEAAENPLLYHLLVGLEKRWPTEPTHTIEAFLPSTEVPPAAPLVEVDVIIPVYRGYRQTIRCIQSVLADTARPPGRVIVIDDKSPEPRLSSWIATKGRQGKITYLSNTRNLGFVRSVNRGMAEAGLRDVILLNSDTEMMPGSIARLARAAYSSADVASVSPLSNNATICSYPSMSGGPMPEGLDLKAIDEATEAANQGRYVEIPTTVGFCMYIRRAALESVGEFDATAFGRGYGEEVDFCRRAVALGWRHLLACDVFIYHEGAVSFGTASDRLKKSTEILQARYPDYDGAIKRFVQVDPALFARFALTAALLRSNQKPGILLVSHGKGGGVARHITDLCGQMHKQANFFLLEPDLYGVSLSVPGIPGHPVMHLDAERHDDLARYLISAGVRRVHIHHVMDVQMDLASLIQRLNVPFDLTVHDYYGICPQINLLPTLDGQYCGEPDARHCNACIGRTPGNGAADIGSWRLAHAWMFRDADRVICPSKDAYKRLERHGLNDKAIVVPHEAVHGKAWPAAPAARHRTKRDPRICKVALLGVLADRKGLATVAAVADVAGETIDLHLIGYPEQELDSRLAARLTVSGPYDDRDLPRLIAEVQPDVFWFPAQWPETYSYTLTAAINTGGAIIAADIGAFPERLKGRPLTWLVPAGANPQAWLAAIAAARQALDSRSGRHATALRAPVQDYYAQDYLRRPKTAPRRGSRINRAAPQRILLIPERLDNGLPSPCAYIRLLQPLSHPAIVGGCDVRIADAASAVTRKAETIVTQRHALTDPDTVAALIAHCRAHKIRLIYDLDDDLLDLPENHPDAGRLSPHASVVRQIIAAADAIWVSTPALAERLGSHRGKTRIVPNGLDERLWWPPPGMERPAPEPVRLLYMGTATHAADLATIMPALIRLQATFGQRVAIDIIGVTPFELPEEFNRIDPPAMATRSYPAFVNWLSLENRWHVGLAPLVDSGFNRGKSAIKALDYAALGLPTIASRIGVYEAVIRDGFNGLLVANTEADWFGAIAHLIRDPARRHQMAVQARARLESSQTLAAQAAKRRQILLKS